MRAPGPTPRVTEGFRTAALRLALAAVLALASLAAAPPLQAQDRSWQVWGAAMTCNTVGEALLLRQISFAEAGLIGVAFNRRFGPVLDVPCGRLRFEAEAQLVRHFGIQNHWEVNLPIGIRYTPARRLLGIDSVSFLIGPSRATEIPLVELQRGGGSGSRGLIHLHLERARDLAAYPGSSVFLRVHHRSAGFGLIPGAVGSNAIAVGFRRAF